MGDAAERDERVRFRKIGGGTASWDRIGDDDKAVGVTLAVFEMAC